MKSKKILSVILSAVMLCGTFLIGSPALAAEEMPFTDVKSNHWFYPAVNYCVNKGYVAGMTDTTFVPNGNLTRAQFLTLLAKLDGVDLTQYDTTEAGFSDVKTSHWFNKVVCWAVEQGITSGLSETKFGPNNNVTRAQLARFFYVFNILNYNNLLPTICFGYNKFFRFD